MAPEGSCYTSRMAWLRVDGRQHEVVVDGDRSLLEVLRSELGITAPKYGCGEGQCGACAVLLDGSPVLACSVPLHEAVGRRVTTAAGLAEEGLHPVQQAFCEVGALQCGYCTPGMVVEAAALLARHPDPSEADIAAALDGHICRCGGYPRILRAVRRAAEIARGAAPTELPEDPPAPALEARHAPWDRLPPERRAGFEVLGPGAIVVAPPSPSRWGAPKGGAWIHAAPDGTITAFTGKVEVGQGTRTGLVAVVAEELKVPMERVRLVMGDTDVCPFDMGTFGSRSTPDVVPDMRRAAATLRALLDREPLGTESRVLEVVSGEVPLAPAAAWTTAGRELPRRGLRAAVTGARIFPHDVVRPGMLHGRVLRPPAFGATLVRVDLSGAEALPGVTVVREGDLVAVAAPTRAEAAASLAAIEATWRTTPQPGEGDLEAYLRANPVDSFGWESVVHEEEGDVDAAFAASDTRLQATYTAAYIAHVPIETRCAVAEWSGERVTVWIGSQRPFGVRAEVAGRLGIAEARVRVIVPDTGDGFGGKHVGDFAAHAARLARVAGKPVRVAWSREEEFTWGYLRPAAVMDLRAGLRDGRLTAWEHRNLNAGTAGLRTPYAVHSAGHHFQPAASPLRQGAYRALAATVNHFARESAMDELATAIGEDPVAFRLHHLADERLSAVLTAAAERIGWGRDPGPGHGLGIALGFEKGGRVATTAEVAVVAGRVIVLRLVTASECGAIINHDALRAQVEGCAVMGLGGALFEAVHFEGGRILNPRLSQYRVPRFHDMPATEVVLLDRPDLPSAGAGESPIVCIAPALANAIHAATGRRLRRLPLAPNGVLED